MSDIAAAPSLSRSGTDVDAESVSETTGDASAVAPTVVTPELLSDAWDVRDVQLSLDGARVAYVLQPMSKAGEQTVSSLWVHDVRAGNGRQWTSGLWDDSSPRWSPDGTRLAFLSDRAERGKHSVYVLSADGGEGQRVWDEQGSIGGLRWTPDGTCLTLVYTAPETEEEEQRKKDRDDPTIWDTDEKFGTLWLLDPATKKAERVSPADRQVHAYAVSQDGTRVAICTTRSSRLDDIFLETELTVSALAADASGTLVLRRAGVTEDLVWSADGSRLAFLGPRGKTTFGEAVFAVAASGGEAKRISPDRDVTIERLDGLDGGASLLLGVSDSVDLRAWRMTWDGSISELTAPDVSGWSVRRATANTNGSLLAAAWQTGQRPVELALCRTQPDGDGLWQTVSAHNEQLAALRMGRTETVEWESDPGVTVQGILVHPIDPPTGERVPLIVQVHGGPTWAWSNWFYGNWHDWAQLLASRGYAVLMPNPRGSTGRGTAYTNALYGDIGGGEYRDMLSGVDAMIERGLADPQRLGIGGWSWGGYMTAWAVSQTTRFAAAAMGAGVANMVSDNSSGDIPNANLSLFEESMFADPEPLWERSAIRHIAKVTTPTLVLHGESDSRVHPAQSKEFYVALRNRGVPTRMVTYPREGHGISERKHQIHLQHEVVDWFERWMPARPTVASDDASASESDAGTEQDAVNGGN